MVFKKRMFHRALPELDTAWPAEPGQDALREARLAEFVAALPDIDACDVSITLCGECVSLSGYVATALERLRLEAALAQAAPGIRIDNRVQVR